MQNSSAHIYNEFHDRAREVFFAFCNDLKHSTSMLDRRRDENVFQQVQNKYTARLKHQLESIAMEILNRNENQNNKSGSNHQISQFIIDYINEFKQRTKSL